MLKFSAMIIARTSIITGAVAALGVIGSLAQAQETQIIYQDSFSGLAQDDLGTRTPDISATGDAWRTAFTREDADAVQIFSADGMIAKDGPNGTHNAGTVLPLTLEENTVYTLEATFLNNNPGWVAVGFASTDTILQGFGSRHANGNAVSAFGGYAWGLSRNNPGGTDQELFNGIGTDQGPGFVDGDNGGNFADPSDEVTISIVLDTTDTAAITAACSLNGVSIGGTQTLAATAFTDIDFVGVSTDGQQTGDGATASISSFLLTAVSEAVLLGDVDGNNLVDFDDIGPFITALSLGENQAEADIDGSGTVDFADIAGFIALLANQ